MKAFISQNGKILLALTLFISMVAFALFGGLPLYKRMVLKRDAIQALGANRDHEQKQISQLPDLRAQYERIVADEGRLDILLTQERMVEFVKTLEGLAADNHVTIAIASNDEPIKEAKKKSATADEEDETEQKKTTKSDKLVDGLTYPGYVRLSVTLTGSYQDSVNFLSQMENLPTALDVIGVKMHSKPVDEKKLRKLRYRTHLLLTRSFSYREANPSFPLKNPQLPPQSSGRARWKRFWTRSCI